LNVQQIRAEKTAGYKPKPIAPPQKLLVLLAGILLAALVAYQQYYLGKYNNFSIFSTSFGHLLNNKNLYLEYPQQYYDLFLYNPTFSVLFAPFTLLPTWPGMACWLVLSMLLYMVAVNAMPITRRAKYFLLALCLADCINALQHMQVNHLNLALVLFAFINMQNNRQVMAAFLTVLLLFVKVYPAAVGLCFVFFPNKIKFLLACAVWAVVFFSVPLLFVSLPQLLQQYQHWFTSLSGDKSMEECKTALSLISFEYQVLKTPIDAAYLQFGGLIVMLVPLVLKQTSFSSKSWQLTYLAGLLLFIIVFNHAAESATYLLAVAGVALWYTQTPTSLINKILLALVLVFTVLSITDIFPRQLKNSFIQPYSIRALPCLLVWIKLMYDLLTKPKPNASSTPLSTGHSAAYVQTPA